MDLVLEEDLLVKVTGKKHRRQDALKIIDDEDDENDKQSKKKGKSYSGNIERRKSFKDIKITIEISS